MQLLTRCSFPSLTRFQVHYHWSTSSFTDLYVQETNVVCESVYYIVE